MSTHNTTPFSLAEPCDAVRDRFFAEWERFTATGSCQPGVIRPVILESWKRCRANGINPFMSPLNCYLTDQKQFQQIVQDNSFFLSLARPYMDILANIVEGTGFIGLLSCREGNVLHAVGNPSLLKSAANGLICPGAIRSEPVAGTTAIALVLINGEPIQIFSAEHYCKFYHEWTCSAAPIHDETGRIIGVLNLSGDYRLVHKHTLGIVVSLAKAMEHAVCLSLANSYLRNCLDSSENGMVILDNNNIIKLLSKKISKYCYPAKCNIHTEHIDKVFMTELPVSSLLQTDNCLFEKTIPIKKNNRESTLLLNVQSIHDKSNQVIGKLLSFKENKELHRIVHRMVGAYATFTFDDILGQSVPMLRVINLAKQVAPTHSRVLIQGESGTGKEMLAQSIHNLSGARKGAFIGINCSAIPPELVESELFGYEEGAFSGAKKGGMLGKFELANEGTLFLDEIDSMPTEMQIKLLRVLEENKVTRLGGKHLVPVRVRIIAASSKNLRELVDQGRMRLDLFYRISTVTLDIPPLRERREDIPLIAETILHRLCHTLGQFSKTLSAEVMNAFEAYGWPGNVRELGNVLERAILLAQDAPVIEPSHMDSVLFQSAEQGTVPPDAVAFTDWFAGKSLANIEQEAIACALKQCGYNISQAAHLLGIHRNTLSAKLKTMHIQVVSATPVV